MLALMYATRDYGDLCSRSMRQMRANVMKTDITDEGLPKVPLIVRHPRMVIVAITAVIVLVFTAHAAGRLAGELALNDRLRSIRTQITLYKIHHLGILPCIEDNDLPQLTASTNPQGWIGPPGPEYTRGPYFLVELPRNPIDGSNRVTAVVEPGKCPTSVAGSLGGWQYDETTGMVWPNNSEYFD